MKIKAIIWTCGLFVTATGLFLGLRSAARAIGVDYNGKYELDHPVRLELKRVCYSREADDAFSPDAFREELLK